MSKSGNLQAIRIRGWAIDHIQRIIYEDDTIVFVDE